MRKRKELSREQRTVRYLVAAARRVWRWDPERRAVLNEAERRAEPEKPAGKRTRRICITCLQTHPKKRVQADHIIPIGPAPRGFSGWDGYYTRLFCERSNLQPLCTKCHSKKTKTDIQGMRGK